jgi:hypothetical protein
VRTVDVQPEIAVSKIIVTMLDRPGIVLLKNYFRFELNKEK